MPEDMPDRMLDRMPEDMSDRMPEDMPDRMPEDLPDRMPEDMPEHLPEDMPDRMPNRMPEDMSDRMPQDWPVRKCINVMMGITRSKVIFLLWNLKFDDSSDIYFPALVRWFRGILKTDQRSADISYQCIAVNSEQVLHFRKEYPRTTQAGTPSYDLVYDFIEL